MPEAVHDGAIFPTHPAHGASAVARFSMRLSFSGPASLAAGTLVFIEIQRARACVHRIRAA
jgi:hypothetical protein